MAEFFLANSVTFAINLKYECNKALALLKKRPIVQFPHVRTHLFKFHFSKQ